MVGLEPWSGLPRLRTSSHFAQGHSVRQAEEVGPVATTAGGSPLGATHPGDAPSGGTVTGQPAVLIDFLTRSIR